MNESFSLGTGSMGTVVYVGIMDDGSEVAIKRMLIHTCKVAAENEKAILTLIDTKKSPFIVSYRHFLRDNIFMYLIVDLCEETLADHVLSQSAKHVQEHGRRMIKEILTGLKFLHGQGVLHRDLKPSNVLVDVEGHMRLADFGISRVLNEDETSVQTNANGTQGWMPSEVIETANQKRKGRYKKKSDVQVAGMIAYFILSKGEHPFGPVYDRMGNILKGNPVNLEKLDDFNARSFVSKLISHKIDDRPRACEALCHLYINEETKRASKPCDKKDAINRDKHCTPGDAEHNFQPYVCRSIFSPDDDGNYASDNGISDYEDNEPYYDEHSPADDENDPFDIDIHDLSGEYEGDEPDYDKRSPADDENDPFDIDIHDPSGEYEDDEPDHDEHHSPADDENDPFDIDMHDPSGEYEDDEPDYDEHHSPADNENDPFDIDIHDPSGEYEDDEPDYDEHHSPAEDENDPFDIDIHDPSGENEDDEPDYDEHHSPADNENDPFDIDIHDPSGENEDDEPDYDEHYSPSDDENAYDPSDIDIHEFI